MAVIDDVRSVLAPPHPAGRPFIIGGLIAMAAGLAIGLWLIWLGLLFTLFCLYFFRNPERFTPSRPGILVAPADGRVVYSGMTVPPPELGLGSEPRWKVSIFLSVLNVHVNRIPISGEVSRIRYHAGAFVSANLDKASTDNERNAIMIRLADGQEVAVVQIAGLIARRILCNLHEGEPVRIGQRFGIIRFGSRTDLYLPKNARPLIELGQTMIGAETVIADMPL